MDTNQPVQEILPDMQNQEDQRKIPIDRVGVTNLKYPIAVKDRDKDMQHTIATISMTVDLPMEFKGTHMSRFVEILECSTKEFHVNAIFPTLERMQERLNSNISHLEIKFPYFKEKKAPVTGTSSLMSYNVTFNAVKTKDKEDFILSVDVPVTTLCPCSKEIAQYGAHNQRGEVRVSVRSNDTVWIEDLIEVIERSASSELYSLLKREDEKYVTERAYENPVFVEDLVRNVVQEFKKNGKIDWFRVEAENFESIHNHNAYAMIESHNNK